jgi:hypothetical protein
MHVSFLQRAYHTVHPAPGPQPCSQATTQAEQARATTRHLMSQFFLRFHPRSLGLKNVFWEFFNVKNADLPRQARDTKRNEKPIDNHGMTLTEAQAQTVEELCERAEGARSSLAHTDGVGAVGRGGDCAVARVAIAVGGAAASHRAREPQAVGVCCRVRGQDIDMPQWYRRARLGRQIDSCLLSWLQASPYSGSGQRLWLSTDCW